MKQTIKIITITITILSFFIFSQITFALTVSEIKQRIIKESIESYPGNCPCPYNYASNGSSCGGRSAYSREGGYEPICYPKDVTPQMIKEYKSNNKL